MLNSIYLVHSLKQTRNTALLKECFGHWRWFNIMLFLPESSLKMKCESDYNNRACITANDMTDNPMYAIPSPSYSTTANMWASKDEESITMDKNPMYAIASETIPDVKRGN